MSSKIIVMSYLSQPSLSSTHLYFISEEDLWRVPLEGARSGVMTEATRLTAGLGPMAAPQVSPDGKFVALASEEEGHCEVYVLSTESGEMSRLTYLAGWSYPIAWRDSKTIVFKSNAKHPHRQQELFQISVEGGLEEPLSLGTGTNLDFRADGKIIFERNMHRPDPSYWKRYRGGTMGQLWVAASLDADFIRLNGLKGNLSCPHWVGDRIFFLSDEPGLGRIFSCDENGGDFKAHGAAFTSEYYFRNLASNGQVLAFQSAGELFLYDPASDQITQAAIRLPSHHPQRKRKTVDGTAFLDHFSLRPQGDRMMVCSRGRVFHFGHWGGPLESVGQETAIRYQHPEWLPDGNKAVVVADDGLHEWIEVHTLFGGEVKKIEPKDLPDGFGRIVELKAAPREVSGAVWIALSNHRNELFVVNLEDGETRRVHRNEHQFMGEFNWSPDGRYLAFSQSLRANQSCIAVYDLESKVVHAVTRPVLEDFAPSFDPHGRYLYFVSKRAFNPVYDDLLFDMSFVKARLPLLIVLKKDGVSPFVRESSLPESFGGKAPELPKFSEVKCEIDFDGIENRVLQFPVQEGLYTQIQGIGNKVLWSYPQPGDEDGKEYLDCFDFETGKFEYYGTGISGFQIRPECGVRVVREGKALRLVKAGEKADDSATKDPGIKSGYVDLSRLKFLTDPRAEWRQMFNDAWRMQKEFFWREDLNGVDWDAVYRRYQPIVEKVDCRREFSDLIWEVIGELGTSHAYERGGDYRGVPIFAVGLLGAEFKLHASGGYEIVRLLEGDRWNPKATSPLLAPGVALTVGDRLVRINGVRLDEKTTPFQACLNLAGKEVRIEWVRANESEPKQAVIRLLSDEADLRYREWVEANRKIVKEKSKGRLGYIHIPNMVGKGYAEFHRDFLYEVECDGLVVDVRFNGGGHVSQLLLERLARRPIGKDESRWMGTRTIPYETPRQTVVAITNEYAGSDGDIFSHTFKMRKIGKLIGMRTWGGVVGIWPRFHSWDGGYTTQPEFATWFQDIQYGLENFGAVPDIEVEFPPHEHRKRHDPQLDRAIDEAMKDLS